MNKFQWPALFGLQERDDALASYRDRVMYGLAIASVLVLLPFAVNNLLQERFLLAGGMAFAMAVLAANAAALHVGRPPPIPFWMILLPSIGGMYLALQMQGAIGALWSYPLVLLFHFAVSRRQANVLSVVQLATITALVHHFIGTAAAIRFFVTLTLTMFFINVTRNIVDDLHHRLIEQTILDPLTGAYNRRHMESCLDYAIERSRRSGTPVSVLMIDIDYFKRINDEYGHAVGDAVLRDVVDIIGNRARRLDLLFRIGGEEFLLLLPDTREEDACKLGDDLRQAVADAFRLRELPVTVSIGVSEWHRDDDQDSWLKHADDALYLAKEMGRDRVVHRTGLYLLKPSRHD